MLVAAGGLLRLQVLDPGKAGALEDLAGRGRRDAGRRGRRSGDGIRKETVRPATCLGVGPRKRRGLDERSAQPAGPRY